MTVLYAKSIESWIMKRTSESEKSNSLDFRLHIKSKFQGTLEDVLFFLGKTKVYFKDFTREK